MRISTAAKRLPPALIATAIKLKNIYREEPFTKNYAAASLGLSSKTIPQYLRKLQQYELLTRDGWKYKVNVERVEELERWLATADHYKAFMVFKKAYGVAEALSRLKNSDLVKRIGVYVK